MTSREIRSSFLSYFERHGHRIVASSPLVPAEDPTLLFTNAGMNQFKDTFLGREKRQYKRATSSQKCMRVSGKHNDLENVGPSHSHHTFFEMLGNFSFGDYFKRDAIPFAWELLTGVWKLPPDRLIPSIFKGERGIPRDDEAYEIWKELVPSDRILELGLDDNFWQMGETGPCGRCSEIYYVRDSGSGSHVEIWNNVFMEFERSADGTLSPLPAPSIDTGMGLERISAVIQGKSSNYDTDLFTPLLAGIGELCGRSYAGTSEPHDIWMRVIADHIRATTFLIADGVMPSNEWRGYVLRKIMRRAMRHGMHLGMAGPFLHRLVGVLDREMGDAYHELRANRDVIERTILAEEKRFEAVLTDGLPRLEAEIATALESPDRVLSGEAAFRLYDTFGLPYEFIEDTAATQDVVIDLAGYERAMEAQRQRGRTKNSFTDDRKTDEFALADEAQLRSAGDDFEGYENTTLRDVRIGALFDDSRQRVDALANGHHGYVTLARTPFYVEAGGQISDVGRLSSDETDASATVEGMVRMGPGLPRAHRVRVTAGTLHPGDRVTAEVDVDVRNATRRNHTATHLLHAALRQVLGGHVKQEGSLVAPDRLRFDFFHFQPLTREEREDIERIVNERIRANTPVLTEVRPTTEAIASGAMALFTEKYGEMVRVVSVPGFSTELCGGTHVAATGNIGFFAILAESSVAAGVRRIEAVTGAAAVKWAQHERAAHGRLIDALHVNEDQAVEAIAKLQGETKRLARELTQLKAKLAVSDTQPDTHDTVEVAGVRLARRKVEGLDKDALRRLADSLKARIKSGIVVLASANDGKVQIVVTVTPDLVQQIKAGQIAKEIAPIVEGTGGGRPDFAEAGGKRPDKIDEMLQASQAILAKLLGAA